MPGLGPGIHAFGELQAPALATSKEKMWHMGCALRNSSRLARLLLVVSLVLLRASTFAAEPLTDEDQPVATAYDDLPDVAMAIRSADWGLHATKCPMIPVIFITPMFEHVRICLGLTPELAHNWSSMRRAMDRLIAASNPSAGDRLWLASMNDGFRLLEAASPSDLRRSAICDDPKLKETSRVVGTALSRPFAEAFIASAERVRDEWITNGPPKRAVGLDWPDCGP